MWSIRWFSLAWALVLVALSAQPQIPASHTPNDPGPVSGHATRAEELPPSRQVSSDSTKPAFDSARLQQEAKELAEVSASIPADMDRINRGLLPKDVIEKLKRVEKLSKHLRNQLTQ